MNRFEINQNPQIEEEESRISIDKNEEDDSKLYLKLY